MAPRKGEAHRHRSKPRGATLNADLEMGGFGRDSRGLARELYASVAATAVATHQTEADGRGAFGAALEKCAA